MRYTVLVSFLFVLTACQPGNETPEVPADSTAVQPAASSAILVLDTEGLRFTDPASGSSRPLVFGTAQAQVVEAVTNVQGAPQDEGVNSECGAGPLGYGESYIVTPVDYGGDPANKTITTYYRRWFTVADPTVPSGTHARVQDGAAATAFSAPAALSATNARPL